MSTTRWTAGQALTRFLAAQHTERDGNETRLIAGVWGILGDGNVAGLGQALHEYDEAGLREAPNAARARRRRSA